jgi:hypothetical protein
VVSPAIATAVRGLVMPSSAPRDRPMLALDPDGLSNLFDGAISAKSSLLRALLYVGAR